MATERTGVSESIEPVRGTGTLWRNKPEHFVEAGAGIEPANSGFADRDLTTWLPRRVARADNIVVAALVSSAEDREMAFAPANGFTLALLHFNASTNPIS